MVALLGGIGIIVGIVVFIVTIMGLVRIVTNCGYSGWWVLVPFAPPLIGYVFGIILLASASLNGGPTTGSHILGIAVGYFVIEFLCWLVSWFIFIRFAFADWPLLQQARGRQGPQTGFGSFGRAPGGAAGGLGAYPGAGPPAAPGAGPAPPWGAPATAWAPPNQTQAKGQSQAAQAPGTPPASSPESAEPGWYRSGPVGAGEQSYWDGTAWTARRRWQKNAWIDLPMAPPDAPTDGPA